MNGRQGKKAARNPVSVRGPWIAMPLDFLRSRAWCELSPQAAKMLLDLCSALGPNAKGNGDLSAAPAVMRPKGWTSNGTKAAALQELIQAHLVLITREGGRRLCALYAVTLWPLDCDPEKINHGPGAFTTLDWEGPQGERAKRPTLDDPAAWNAVRKNEKRSPATGEPPSVMTPPRVNPGPDAGSYAPATGSKPPVSGERVHPPRVTYLDKPSAAVPATPVTTTPGTGNPTAGTPKATAPSPQGHRAPVLRDKPRTTKRTAAVTA